MGNILQEGADKRAIPFRGLDRRHMPRAPDQFEPRALDQTGGLAHQIGGGGAIFAPCGHQRWQGQPRGAVIQIGLRNGGTTAQIAFRAMAAQQPR